MRLFLQIMGAIALLLVAGTGIWWQTASTHRKDVVLEELGLRRSPMETARSSLQALQAESELSVLNARFLIRSTTSKKAVAWLPKSLVTSSKTLMVAGTVRYVLDLSKLDDSSLTFDKESNTLTIIRPPVKVSDPSFHVEEMEQMKDGAVLMWLTKSEADLDRKNWDEAILAVRHEAQNQQLAKTANDRADALLARLFRLPLIAAGHSDVKVRVHGQSASESSVKLPG